MKKTLFLMTLLFAAIMPSMTWAQWTATGNNIYNTNFNASPLNGKVAIGFDTPANDYYPYTYKAVLQVKGLSGTQQGSNYPAPAISILAHPSGGDVLELGTGNANINSNGTASYGGFIKSTTLNMMSGNVNIAPLVANTGAAHLNLNQGNINVKRGIIVIGDVPVPIVGNPPYFTPSMYTYGLYVEKGILAEKVKVALKTTADWSDYVFSKDYKLMPLEEVESYVNQNKHLPGIPSAEEVVKEGIDMASMDAKLLEKIEELTLYMIEMKKENEKAKKENEKVKEINKNLEQRILLLERK